MQTYRELFWQVYYSLSKQHPKFLTLSRNAPWLPHHFRNPLTRRLQDHQADCLQHGLVITPETEGVGKDTHDHKYTFLSAELRHRQESEVLHPENSNGTVYGHDGRIDYVFDKSYIDFRHLKTMTTTASLNQYWQKKACSMKLWDNISSGNGRRLAMPSHLCPIRAKACLPVAKLWDSRRQSSINKHGENTSASQMSE